MKNKQPINLPIYSIVRYHEDGSYDCIWSSNYTLHNAQKRCKELNEDYHKNYGVYVVEDAYGNQYK